jgi:hypothetical protein
VRGIAWHAAHGTADPDGVQLMCNKKGPTDRTRVRGRCADAAARRRRAGGMHSHTGSHVSRPVSVRSRVTVRLRAGGSVGLFRLRGLVMIVMGFIKLFLKKSSLELDYATSTDVIVHCT